MMIQEQWGQSVFQHERYRKTSSGHSATVRELEDPTQVSLTLKIKA